MRILRKSRNRKLPIVLKHSEVLQLFTKTTTFRNKIFLEFVYYCGLRVSEACNLKLQYIDMKDEYIKVVEGKGGKDRFVPIPKVFLKDLKLYLQINNFTEEDRIFKFGRVNAHNIIKKACVSINPKVHMHTLRHSYATQLAESGQDAVRLADLLGHEDLAMTRKYVHMSKGAKKKIVDDVF